MAWCGVVSRRRKEPYSDLLTSCLLCSALEVLCWVRYTPSQQVFGTSLGFPAIKGRRPSDFTGENTMAYSIRFLSHLDVVRFLDTLTANSTEGMIVLL